ncbi:hypothetical protein DVV91_09850 [Clostridium botulinum]|uniref:hypothetical protein n=1 Tax=Clostridium botulinum TaxID=1491 RepID=UPI0019678C8E|nr:hypothetical protein [Clostridium botulinum]MBN1074643.1 hypothetical protein [Clostridium botulinum]
MIFTNVYYQATLYDNAILKRIIRSNNLELLKSKCEPYLLDDKITTIDIQELRDIGYFKVSEEIKPYVQDKII